MNKKILFIEDEMRLHEIFKKVFESEGLNLVSAYDGAAGLKIAEAETPDMVILDLILPEKNGFEVLKEIKDNPRLKNIPIIILSNLEDDTGRANAMKMGANDYLVKANHSLTDVMDKIKKTLNINND